MDGESSRSNNSLETILEDRGSEPQNLTLEYLREITNNFSPTHLLGKGGFGAVYKGVERNGNLIAVKKLIKFTEEGIGYTQFKNEVSHLVKLNHPNIVQLLGYCHETYNIKFPYKGTYVDAEQTEMLLCLEYLPKGSLRDRISGESSGLGRNDWDTRYKIIDGICRGLHYLHEEPKDNALPKDSIIHMDLKPANILLDDNMLPKIADFGLSRLFGEEQTRAITINRRGTLGYMAPEYITGGTITKKSDIFSLGVIIIEIITGQKRHPHEFKDKTSEQKFMELVLKDWKNRLEKTPGYASRNVACQQIRRCIQIGLDCFKDNSEERPTTHQIINMLYKLEGTEWSNEGEEPQSLSLEELRKITNNFSDERLLGKGGFGVTYKGVLQNGDTIAVKTYSKMQHVSDKLFENEVRHLMKLKHPNIVRLLGYCSETENILLLHNGKYIYAEKSERLLCLEYMPKGSLREHLSDESCGLDWDTRYKIIEGICYGLHYLHEEWKVYTPIIHMDLKPANILLDDNMVPKIMDFGLSRLFGEEQTRTCTISCTGTLGYMAPEYLTRGIITKKLDIFSLGIMIIEIITGRKDYPDETETSSQQFIELVLTNWRNRLDKAPWYASRNVACQQIRRCIEIGLICVKCDWEERPTTGQIIKMLHGSEGAECSNKREPASDLPAAVEESDWCGVDQHTHVRCEHGLHPRRKVCWARQHTGRRFLGCPLEEDDDQCHFIHWIDPEWDSRVQKTIGDLLDVIAKLRVGEATASKRTTLDSLGLDVIAKLREGDEAE